MHLKTCLDPLQVCFGTHLVTQNRSRNGLEAILKGIRNRILILVAKRPLGGAMICTQNPTPLLLPGYMYSRARFAAPPSCGVHEHVDRDGTVAAPSPVTTSVYHSESMYSRQY